MPRALQICGLEGSRPLGRWAYMEDRLSKIMLGKISLKTCIEIYVAVLQYCRPHARSRDESALTRIGAWVSSTNLLYWRLSAYLVLHLENVVQRLLKCSSVDLVTSYAQEWDRYMQAARANHLVFDYLNQNAGWRRIDGSIRQLRDVYSLHQTQWASIVEAVVLESLRPAVYELLLTCKPQKRAIIHHPSLQRVIYSLNIPRPVQGARAIHIAINQLLSNARPRINTVAKAKKTSRRKHRWLAVTKHWCLIVVSDEGHRTLFEIAKVSGSSVKPQMLSHDQIEPSRLETSFLLGYTFLSDEEIEKLAKSIVLKRGEGYRLLDNNCQTFCRLLFLCLRIPLDVNMILEAIPAFPHELAREHVRRQIKELEAFSFYHDSDKLVPLLSLPRSSTPISIERSLAWASRLALLVLAALACTSTINTTILLLLMLMVSWWARLDIYRLVPWHFLHRNALQLTYSILYSQMDDDDFDTTLRQLQYGELDAHWLRLFHMQSPQLFPPQYHLVPRQARTLRFDNFMGAREIEDAPVGFEPKDVAMALRVGVLPDAAEMEAFLESESPQEYQISLAFVGKGHAEVILRTGRLSDIDAPTNLDLTSEPPVIAPEAFSPQNHELLHSTPQIQLRVLHLRFIRGSSQTLELALEKPPSGIVSSYRHADLYRIRTTERRLRHIALQSCPNKHRILVDDCATFAYNFLTGLLDHLHRLGRLSEQQRLHQIKLLGSNNHVRDGSLGRSEVVSREHRVMGESVYLTALPMAATQL